MYWSSLDILVRQGLKFVVTVILARLLVPEDFGTVALLALFLGLGALFVNGGFSAALIQKQDATHTDESTIFWFNIGAAVVVTLALIALSPWIARYFELPVLRPLTMLMACNIFISAFGTIHTTLLTKQLNFKALTIVGAVATVISSGLAIYLARSDYGVWSLAWQPVSATICTTLLLWGFSSWRPLMVFSGSSFNRLMAFSGWIFAASLLDTIYQKGYTLLIGKYYGTYDLGIYNQADNTQQTPTSLLTSVISRVTFPLFSSIAGDAARLRLAVRLSVRSTMLITSPAMLGLAVLATPFVGEVFGEQWLPAAPLLQILCLAGLLWPLHVINVNVLRAQGHAKLSFRLALVKKSLGVVLLVAGTFFGLTGIAWSRVLSSTLGLAINGYYTGKFLDYGAFEQAKDYLSAIATSVMMGAVVILSDRWIEIGGATELLVLIVIGAVSYSVFTLFLGLSALKDSVEFMAGRRSL
ncbi:lipopolysaccharide biosynthesis protein [Halioglobus sp.]|nr:lipopolysaccharide biosynthesis protein [Halioglobus sp.]